MSDIVERLRGRKVRKLFSTFITENVADPLCEEAAAEIERLRSELEQVRSIHQRFADRRNLSLSFNGKVYCEDDNPDLWTVYRRSGGINDTEWHVLGRGETPLEAMTAAIFPDADGKEQK